MKRKISVLFLILTGIIFSQEKDKNDILKEVFAPAIDHQSETLFKPNYPEGIYMSKLDFINKIPSSIKTVIPFEFVGFNEPSLDSVYHNCYFYDKETNKKIRKVFAISYHGHLYFQLKAILKNRNKYDRAQSTNYHNTFVRVISGGENYFYTEAELVNQWAAGVSVNFGVIGGVIAGNLIKGKGLVWDFKNQEFNIFKSCKDFNDFIEKIYPEGVQKCTEHQPDMFAVRKTIDQIK